MVRLLTITPLLSILTTLAFSCPNTNKLLYKDCPFSAGILDKAKTSATSEKPSKAGSKRLVEFSVVADPFVAVPALKSTSV